MKINPTKKRKAGNWVVLAVPIAFIAFSVWVTLRLISEGSYYSATGWGISSIMLTFFLVLRSLKPKENTLSNISPPKSQGTGAIHEGDEFVLLYSSKDIVRITQIENALRVRDIECIVLDRHGSVMMSFVPEIEMRIMVHQKDFDWSVQIMNKLMEQ